MKFERRITRSMTKKYNGFISSKFRRLIIKTILKKRLTNNTDKNTMVVMSDAKSGAVRKAVLANIQIILI